MATSIALSPTSESIYQNIPSNPLIKLTLCERVSQLFSRLYEKISNLFSRKPNQIKKLEVAEPIYDVPKNNQPIKKLTLYERMSNLFSRGPSQIELLEKKVSEGNTQFQQKYQELHHYICINAKRINDLNSYVSDLEKQVNAKESENNSLKETISRLEHESNSHPSISRSDSGFSESPPLKKKHGLLSKAKHTLKLTLRKNVENP